MQSSWRFAEEERGGYYLILQELTAKREAEDNTEALFIK